MARDRRVISIKVELEVVQPYAVPNYGADDLGCPGPLTPMAQTTSISTFCIFRVFVVVER